MCHSSGKLNNTMILAYVFLNWEIQKCINRFLVFPSSLGVVLVSNEAGYGVGAGSRGRDTQWGGGLSNAVLQCNTTAFVAFTKKKITIRRNYLANRFISKLQGCTVAGLFIHSYMKYEKDTVHLGLKCWEEIGKEINTQHL